MVGADVRRIGPLVAAQTAIPPAKAIKSRLEKIRVMLRTYYSMFFSDVKRRDVSSYGPDTRNRKNRADADPTELVSKYFSKVVPSGFSWLDNN
jgi:hypothetical protein